MNARIARLLGEPMSGVLGANTPGFAIEAAGQGSGFSRSANDRAVDDKAVRRWLARLRSRARLAFGIHSKFGSTSARPALLGIALGVTLGPAWRQLRRWIARSRQRHALAEPDDRVARHRRDSRARHRRQPRTGAPRDRTVPADLSSRLRLRVSRQPPGQTKVVLS